MNLQNKQRWILPLAILSLLILVVLLTKSCFSKPEPRGIDIPQKMTDSVVYNVEKLSGSVEAQMKNVDFHIDEGIVLQIKKLRGRLIPIEKYSHPIFNNKESYILDIYSANIKMDMKSLSNLLNKYVFGYKGSALKNIQVSISGKQIKQEGSMRGIPFTIISDISVTPEGKIRLHPTDTKAFGIKMNGLMKFFNIKLKSLIPADSATGINVIDNDLLLDPILMLPLPRNKGHLKSIEVENGELTQVFFSKSALPLKPYYENTNYMYFRGGNLTFGKLTMKGTDIEIIDNDPKDPFDFFNDHYFEQLIAGYHKTTLDDGLIIYMPDYSDIKK